MDGLSEPLPRRSSVLAATVVATLASIAAYGVTLVQQVLYARTLGVGPDTDALAAALAWAIATSGLVGTTLASVLVPRYVRSLETDPADATAVFRAGSAVGLAVGLVASVVTLVAAEVVAFVLLPGSSMPVRAHLAVLLRLTAPLHLLWVGVWLGVAMANGNERFAFAGLSPIAAALPVLATLALVPGPSVDQVAVAYVVGAAFQALVLVARLGARARGLLPSVDRAQTRALGRPIAWLGTAFIGFGLVGLALRVLASAGDSGDVAAVDYALRLAGVGEQVLLAGLLAVVLTRWSRRASPGMPTSEATASIRVGLGAIVAAAALIGLMAPEVVGILFRSPKFGGAAVADVAEFVRWMTPGLAAHMLLMLAIRGLLARQAARPVLGCALATISGTVAAGLVLQPILGIAGIALAYTIGWGAGAIVAVVALAPQRTTLAGLGGEAVRSTMSAGVAIGSAGLVIAGLDGEIIRVLIGSATAGAVLLVVGLWLRVGFVREMRQLAVRARGT